MAQKLLYNIRHSLWSTRNSYAPVPQDHTYYQHHHQSRNNSLDSHGTSIVTDAEKAPLSTSHRRWISPRVLSDATIGLSDGLTVPFALTAGLSALGDTKVVIYGGFAELFAGAISMGVGGYLGARGECQAHAASLASVRRDIRGNSRCVDEQIRAALGMYGLSSSTLTAVASELKSCPDALEGFLMKYYHEQNDLAASTVRAYVSGLTIAMGYFVGGLLPLLPYVFSKDMQTAFWWSCGVMLHVLFVFGSVKTWLIDGESKKRCLWSGLQMVMLGGLAAGAAMGCVMAIGSDGS